MTDKEKRELKDSIINIFKRFNILGNTASIGELRNNILRCIDSIQEEPVNEDLEEAASMYAKKEYNHKSPATLPNRCIGCYAPIMYAFRNGANWREEQIMTKAVKAVVSQVPCSNEIILYNPCSVDKYYLPQEMNKLGLNKGDKVKVVIIKEN